MKVKSQELLSRWPEITLRSPVHEPTCPGISQPTALKSGASTAIEFKRCYRVYPVQLFFSVTDLAYLSKCPDSLPLCWNDTWKKCKPRSDSRSPEIQAFKQSAVGWGPPREECSAAGHSLQDLHNPAVKQHTQTLSPVTPTTRLTLRFHSSVQNNTFNVNTSGLMGSGPLSLRI